jgi:hypothetical protein
LCESGPWQAKQLFERIGRTWELKEIFSPVEASTFAGAGAESADETAGLLSGGFGVSDGLLASLQDARKSIGITVNKALFLNMIIGDLINKLLLAGNDDPVAVSTDHNSLPWRFAL